MLAAAQRRARARSDEGFSLVELLTSIVVVGAVTSGVGATAVVLVRTEKTAVQQVTASNVGQDLATWFPTDVGNTLADDWDDTPGRAACGAPGANVVTFDWRADDGRAVTVTYRTLQEQGATVLRRTVCHGSTVDESLLVGEELAAPPTLTERRGALTMRLTSNDYPITVSGTLRDDLACTATMTIDPPYAVLETPGPGSLADGAPDVEIELGPGCAIRDDAYEVSYSPDGSLEQRERPSSRGGRRVGLQLVGDGWTSGQRAVTLHGPDGSVLATGSLVVFEPSCAVRSIELRPWWIDVQPPPVQQPKKRHHHWWWHWWWGDWWSDDWWQGSWFDDSWDDLWDDWWDWSASDFPMDAVPFTPRVFRTGLGTLSRPVDVLLKAHPDCGDGTFVLTAGSQQYPLSMVGTETGDDGREVGVFVTTIPTSFPDAGDVPLAGSADERAAAGATAEMPVDEVACEVTDVWVGRSSSRRSVVAVDRDGEPKSGSDNELWIQMPDTACRKGYLEVRLFPVGGNPHQPYTLARLQTKSLGRDNAIQVKLDKKTATDWMPNDSAAGTRVTMQLLIVITRLDTRYPLTNTLDVGDILYTATIEGVRQ